MNQRLKNTTEKLRKLGLHFKILELCEPAVSVRDVVNKSQGDVKVDEICKTLLMKGKDPFAVLIKGLDKVDLKKVENLIKHKVRFLSREEIKMQFEFELGEVCPLFLEIPVIVDKKVLELETANMGSGDLFCGIEMNPRDILKCINHKIEDVVV